MKIEQSAGEYHISRDFSLELEETNPFLSDKGSQSLPVKLPYTQHNLQLLNRPERLACGSKAPADYQARITHGVFQKTGRQVVFSVSPSEGISTTFYLREGEFYSKIKDVKLCDIDFGGIRDPYSGTHAEKATAWLNYFYEIMKGDATDDFVLFPVCTKAEDGTYELLNEPDLKGMGDPYPLTGYRVRTVGDVKCPVGYGVTPFLKVSRVLHYLFTHFGYRLQPSIFNTELRQLVLLNTVADTVCAGKLDYRQLMPDMTVSDFLSVFRDKFGCEFVVDSDKGEVSVLLLSDVLTRPPDMDITPYVVGAPLVMREEFKQLKLRGGTGIERADPAAATMEGLFDNYPFVSEVNESFFALGSKIEKNQVVLRRSEGQYYTAEMNGNDLVVRRMGSSFFPYDKGGSLAGDEREAGDEQVPMLSIPKLQGTPLENFVIPYVGERRHVNTGIQQKDGVKEDKSGAGKALLCFFYGKPANAKWLSGTSFCYDNTGTKWSDISLQYNGEYGLFQRFWAEYDAVLRHAFQPVQVELNLPISMFMRFNMVTPKLLYGVPVLPERLQYTVGGNGLRIRRAVFRTLQLQEPYDLAAEQNIPVYIPSEYYWERCTDYDLLFPYVGPTTGYGVASIDPSPVPRTYDPPTREQYEAGGRYYVETCRVRITVYENESGNERIVAEYNDSYSVWVEARAR